MRNMRFFMAVLFTAVCTAAAAQGNAGYVKEHYNKQEVEIPMRDGVRLFTIIYTPKEASAANKYPMIMQRTCYSVAPYGKDNYARGVGPSPTLMQEGNIFVYQDVRGRYRSEGEWTNMRPIIDKPKGKNQIDEATDTYDTIDWLVKNVKFNNGRVGQWGISYPGYFTAAGILSNHPALKASSPQAPIADFWNDDFHHNGAFLQSYLNTFAVFGVPKTDTTSRAWYNEGFLNYNTMDGYQYNLDMGPLSNVDKKYDKNFFWQEVINHPNYDSFWQARGLLKHYGKTMPAVMLVGGWFDAEDLHGPLAIFKAIKKADPKAYNTIVMTPFGHGRWSRETGPTIHGDIKFGDSIATFYQKEIEAKFFNHFLKGKGDRNTGLPVAYMFDTGLKKWDTFTTWPAKNASKIRFYLTGDGGLSNSAGSGTQHRDYLSDPLKPVPYTNDIASTVGFTPFKYMSEDQRFAGRRTDVLVYQTPVLESDVTLGGELLAKLNIATTGTDADFFVKLIDVYPATERNYDDMPNKNVVLSNYWQMVRSEIMPARFRNSMERPEALVPGKKTTVNVKLQDVLHTFKKGHRIMVQVQSTAFPLFARNPQTFVPNPYKAKASDYKAATESVYDDSYLEADKL